MRISDWSSDVCSSDLFSGILTTSSYAAETRILENFHGSERTRQAHIGPEDGTMKLVIQIPCLNEAEDLPATLADRKSDVEGKSVSVRVDIGGRRIIKNKIITMLITTKTTKRKQ